MKVFGFELQMGSILRPAWEFWVPLSKVLNTNVEPLSGQQTGLMWLSYIQQIRPLYWAASRCECARVWSNKSPKNSICAQWPRLNKGQKKKKERVIFWTLMKAEPSGGEQSTGNVWILHTMSGELYQAQNEQETLRDSISVAGSHHSTNMSFYDWMKCELFVSIRDL